MERARRPNYHTKVPVVCCPDPACSSGRVRQRSTRFSKARQLIIRHYLCLACRKRFRLKQPPETFDGWDRASA